MSTLTAAAQAALTTHSLIVTAAFEWLGVPQNGTCQRCGCAAEPQHNNNPLARVSFYNFPKPEEALLGVLTEVDDSYSRAWYDQTLAKQIAGDFSITEQCINCWACAAGLVYLLSEDRLTGKVTLARALHAAHVGAQSHTSLLYLGGEKEKRDEWNYLMAHMSKPLADIDLSLLLSDGLRRMVDDEFHLTIN